MQPSEHVRACLAAGLDLFPLKPRSKEPLAGANWRVTSHTWDELKAHWNAGGNLGARMSAGDVVLDIDPRHDPEGRSADALIAQVWADAGIKDPQAPYVRTGSGGLHVFFRGGLPEGPRAKRPKWLGLQLEGQYVVAAGSVHPDTGERYVWERTGPLPTLPPALGALLFRDQATQPSPGSGEVRGHDYVTRSLELLDPTAFREYEAWRDLLFACHSATAGSEEGLGAFTAWSTRDPDYAGAAQDIAAIWHSARGSGRTVASLDHAVREAGRTPPDETPVDVPEVPEDTPEVAEAPVTGQRPKRKPSLLTVRHVLKVAGLRVQRDRLTGECYAEWPLLSIERVPLDKHVFNRIYVTGLHEKQQVVQWTKDCHKQQVESAMEDLVEEINPRLDWIKSATWDGQRRMDTWLTDVTGLPEVAYNQAVGRYILEAGMARLIAPGTKVDAMPVLCGPQGCGKSTLVARLGMDRWSTSWQLGQTDIEGMRICHRGWIVEVAELSATRFSKLESIKDFLTRSHDEFRIPYDRDVSSKQRAFIFIGTTNDRRYLIDSTGNRRFLHLEIDWIDLEAFTLEFVEQLWAEAYAFYTPVREVRLPTNLFGTAEEVRKGAFAGDPWEVYAREWVDGRGPNASVDIREAYEGITSRVYLNASRGDVSRVNHLLEHLGARSVGKDKWILNEIPLLRERLTELGWPLIVTSAEIGLPIGLLKHGAMQDLGYRMKRVASKRFWEKVK